MQLSEKQIKEFQDIYKKEYDKELSWEEATEGAYNLMNYAKLMYDLAVQEHKRQLKLEKQSDGFHLEGIGYNCQICYATISNEETWYDKYGIKCLVCHKAFKKKIIPVRALKDKDSWYSMYDLKSQHDIHPQTARKMIRQGELKARVILNEQKKPHFYLFMIKDNPTLGPKKKPEIKVIDDRTVEVSLE